MNFIKLLNNENLKNLNLGTNKWGIPVYGIIEDVVDKFWVSEKNDKVNKGQNGFETHVEHKLLNNPNIIDNPNKKIMYITTEPCQKCAAKIIANKTIKRVVYLFKNNSIKDREYLKGIKLVKYKTHSKRENEIIASLKENWDTFQKMNDKRHKKNKKKGSE